MMENETIILDMEVDANNAKTEMAEMQKALTEIVKTVAGMGTVISASFAIVAKGTAKVECGINSMTEAIRLAVIELETLNSLQETDGGWTEGLSVVSDIGSVIQTLIALTDDLVVAKLASKAEDIAIIALYSADYVVAFGKQVAGLAASTPAWIANTAAKVADTAAQWAQIAATTAWQGICAAATAVTTAFGAAMTFLTSPIGLVVIGIAALIAIIVLLVQNWDTVKAAALSVWEAIKEAFGNAWKWFKETLLDPLINGFKGMVNGIIGFINGMIGGIVDGINVVIGLLNKLKFEIPDWVPVLGGMTFGFDIPLLNAPQIPYLAKGAVLPANRPFLAMVGDQRHGTNVEAPLATIQEAERQGTVLCLLGTVLIGYGRRGFCVLGRPGAWKRLLP